MGLLDRLTFRAVVPRAVRRADHVIAVSERTKRDIVERYGVPESKVTVTPNGVDPASRPGRAHDGYLLFVGAIQARKDPLAALEAARAVGLPLVVAGPEKDASSPASSGTAAPSFAATSRRRSWPSSTAAPRRSCCRPGSRGSGCRCSRRWRAGRRWSPPTSPPCARSAAKPPCTPRTATSVPRRAGRSPIATASRPPGSSGARSSPGRRQPAAPPRSTARCSA